MCERASKNKTDSLCALNNYPVERFGNEPTQNLV